jgi:tetratricopeptide (TPR) repeat protein/predicted aspartyl protease
VRLQCLVRAQFALLVSLWLPVSSFAACKLTKFAELPVTMSNLKPMVSAKINGKEVQFIADSGAFYSMISPGHAAELGLPFKLAPSPLTMEGVGGEIATRIAIVKEFTLASTRIPNVEFVVGGTEIGQGGVGILGQNVFRIADTEYDLGNGMIRLMHPEDCKHAVLAYWVKNGESYSVMDIESSSALEPHTSGVVYLNGSKLHAIFDTGAGTSVISVKAAERAGVKLGAPGVDEEGYLYGLGRSDLKVYVAPFASFKIGDEEIRNARLRIGDFRVLRADMLIGADFFLSHRVYVASSQNKLYFTYSGGPVFSPPRAKTDTVSTESTPAAAIVATPEPEHGETLTAAEFARRGSALAARRDYPRALADLNRACELEPANAEFAYQRATVYLRSNQPDLAMAEFDRVLQLQPNHLQALLARGELRLVKHDIASATADFDSVDRLSAKESAYRLELGGDYQTARLYGRAVAQYDLWIEAHGVDARLAHALNARCISRAWQGENLSKAVSDCNAALDLAAKGSPMSAAILGSRGLVRLRQGDYGKAIKDYDTAIKLTPTEAESFYGRGIAKIRDKDSSGGNSDIAAALKLKPSVADDFKARGLAP